LWEPTLWAIEVSLYRSVAGTASEKRFYRSAAKAALSLACGELPSLRAACFGPKLHTCHEPLRVTERSDAPQKFLPSLRGAQRRGNPAPLASSDTPLGKEQGFHRPAAGEALFTAEKDPKRLAPGARIASTDRRRAAVRGTPSGPAIPGRALAGARCDSTHLAKAPGRPCASRRMRAGTNSGIHAFGRCATPLTALTALATPSRRRCAACSVKQWCLAPAFGCDARRALRRVVALGPRIHALHACFSALSHRIMATSDPRLRRLIRPTRMLM